MIGKIVGNNLQLAYDSRGRKKDLGNTKQVLEEKALDQVGFKPPNLSISRCIIYHFTTTNAHRKIIENKGLPPFPNSAQANKVFSMMGAA